MLLLCAAVLTLHGAVLFLYNGPDNYVKIKLDKPLHAYMGARLVQNWSFFAPTPIDRDNDFVVRGELTDHRVTPWFDVSRSLQETVHANRLSPYQLLATGVLNSLNDLGLAPDLVKTDTPASVLAALPDARYLTRQGAAALNSVYPGRKFGRIQIAVMSSVFPRFSGRRLPDERSKRTLVALVWQPFPHDVAPLPGVLIDARTQGR